MSLIQILDEGDFLGIVYPDSTHISARSSHIKTVYSNNSEDSIIIGWYSRRTLELIYTEVEDPDNPGFPIPSLSDLWDLIMGILEPSIDISNFVFNDGNNFTFLDGNNFKFNN